MTISLGTQNDFTATANASSPQSKSITVASNTDLLVCTISIYDTSSTDGLISSVIFNTTEPLELATQYYDATSDGHVSIWYLIRPSASTGDVVVSFGGTVTDFTATVVEVNSSIGELR